MIISKQNAQIKEIRSLSDKKNRDSLGVYVVESVKLVKEVLSLNLPVKQVVCTQKGYDLLNCACEQTLLVSDEVFKSISQEKTPQGALAVVEKPQFDMEAPTDSCILLDGVSDPANVGAIIRTAAASNYTHVYLTEECADAYSVKSIRASMGGIFRVKVMRANLQSLLSVINMPLVVADMNGKNVFDFDIKDKVVCIKFKGNGFLHNMIRIIVAMLIEVGNNRLEIEKMIAVRP